ncbi:MAG: hypothetical protein WAX69_20085 [Victivallales bacterium]
MKMPMDKASLENLLAKQLDNLLSFDRPTESAALATGVESALKKAEFCFSRCKNPFYQKDGETHFSPFHSGQYSVFLYYLSHCIWTEQGNSGLAERIYYLNKIFNSVDLFYQIKLPEIFHLDHPLGSVMGRAQYSEFFYFSQGCTVGNNKGIYPCIGKRVSMMSGSFILGNSRIGDNCIISTQSLVKDQDVPPNSIVFGKSPDLVIKTKSEKEALDMYSARIFRYK